MRYLIVLPLLLLQGCWFVIFPIPNFGPGNSCVGEAARVGERIYRSDTGKYGEVKSLHGRSSRCQDGSRPILAEVEYE